jgi:hypothetical protein
MQEDINIINNLIELGKITIPALTTLFAGFLGYHYGALQLRKKTRLEHIEKQLSEFYSPIVGRLQRVGAIGELRLKVNNELDKAWRDLCAKQSKPFLDSEKYFEPFKKSIEHDNEQLSREIIPLYDEMLQIFQEKYWLATPSSQAWYSAFFTFVEIWHRWLNGTIPGPVVEGLKHSEEPLKPFYQELENKLGELQKELGGK